MKRKGHGVEVNEEAGTISVKPGEGPQFSVEEGPSFSVAEETTDRAGIASTADLEAAGVNPESIYKKAGEGQSYVLDRFESKGAVIDADSSIGGKGGFASAGDARESITALGRGQSPADVLRIAEGLIASEQARKDLGQKNVNEFVKKAGEIIPGMSKVAYRASGKPFTQATLDKMRVEYDKLAGFEGAHKNLDNPVQVKTVNTLNQPIKKKETPKATPEEFSEQKRKDIIAGKRKPEGTDNLRRTAGQSGLYDIPITTDENIEPNIKLGKDIEQEDLSSFTYEPTEQETRIADRIKAIEDVGPRNELPQSTLTTLQKLEAKQKELKDAKSVQEEIQAKKPITDKLFDQWKAGEISDNKFVPRLLKFAAAQVRPDARFQKNPDEVGSAYEGVATLFADPKFNPETKADLFRSAKYAASNAVAKFKREEGTAQPFTKDVQTLRGKVFRASDRFFKDHGYEPSANELADIIGEDAQAIEDVRSRQFGTEFGSKAEGDPGAKAQDKAGREIGFDNISDRVLGPKVAEIDAKVDDILAARPEIASSPVNKKRRGAKETTLRDEGSKKVKEANTKLDQFVRTEINDALKAEDLRNAYPFLKERFGFTAENFDALDKAGKRKLKNQVVDGLAFEAEQRLAGKQTPSPEFSLEERNPKFSGFEFNAARTTSQRLQGAVTPFLRNSKQRLRGDQFSAILTHRSPEKKAAIRRAARETGANIVDHPLNPGEILVLPAGKTLNDVLKFNTAKNGKAVDIDPRDFTTFNESARPEARQYTNLNINDLLNNINSRNKYLNNINNWGKLNKVHQLTPKDLANVKRALIEEGFNVETSVDKKGDPTLVFSKGRINPQWSIKDEYSAREPQKASAEYTQEVIGRLQTAFPDVEISSTPEAYNKLLKQLRDAGYEAPPGAKGFRWGKRIGLKPGALTEDTPIHELGHVWVEKLRTTNPALWKRGVELLKGSDFMRVVDDIPAYKKLREKGNLATFYEEVMANALGKRGAEIFARNREKATIWDKFVKKAGDWIKNRLGISAEKGYADLTLNDWLDVGAQSILTGDQTAFTSKPVTGKQQVAFSVAEDPIADHDTASAKLAGEKTDWYKIAGIKIPRIGSKGFFSYLAPPAADDYHGLSSKLHKIVGKENVAKVSKAFIDDHHNYITESQKARKAAKALRTPVKKALNSKAAILKGNEVSGAQAVQAHIDGNTSASLDSFIAKPEIQEYIKGMQELGLLKPSEGTRDYTLASPDFDITNYIVNDLYKKSFNNFNNIKNDIYTPQVLDNIRAQQGTRFADAFENSLQRMSTGKSAGGIMDSTTQKWNDWALGSVGTIMFFNFRSAALQMLSVGNYGFSDQVNSAKFIGNLAAGLARVPIDMLNKNSGLRKRMRSDYLNERRQRAGFDVNMADLAASIEGSKNFGDVTKKILNFGFKATSAIDSLAIAVGGEAFVKAGGTERAWIEQSEEAQQSSRPDRVSKWQTTGASKFVLAFANTPAQYFRLAQKAARTIRSKNSSTSEKVGAASKLLWYMAAQNMIFTALQSATWGVFDDDEEKVNSAYNSISDSILRGMGMYGAVISSMKNVLVEADKQSKKPNPDYVAAALKASSISPPLNRKISDLLSIGRAYKYKDEQKEAKAVTKAITVATNLPADWGLAKYNAVKNLWDDKFSNWQKLLLALGYSEYSLTVDKEEGALDFDNLDFDEVDFDDLNFDDVEF